MGSVHKGRMGVPPTSFNYYRFSMPVVMVKPSVNAVPYLVVSFLVNVFCE